MAAIVTLALVIAWVARARLAGEIARAYFRQHGVESTLSIGTLEFSGVSGRFALGPADAPDIAADHIELIFDPLRWTPFLIEVRLIHPVIRARVGADGSITLGSLQTWIDSLQRQPGQSPYVSDDLKVSLTRLELRLATPAGAMVVDGDAQLEKNLPVGMSLRLRPATLRYREMKAVLGAAGLSYDQARGTLSANLSGTLTNGSWAARNITARIDAGGLAWSSKDGQLVATTAHMKFAAEALTVAQTIAAPRLELTAHKISLTRSGKDVEGRADLAVTAEGGIDLALPSLRAADPPLADAIVRNLKHMTLVFAGHAERKAGANRFTLGQMPLKLAGAQGAELHVAALTLSRDANAVTANLEAALTGKGLPWLRLNLRDAVWGNNGFTAAAALRTKFDFAMLRGADLTANGALSWQAGHYGFAPRDCARLTLKSFRPGAGDLAQNVKTAICPSGESKLLEGDASGWTFAGDLRDAEADLPLANLHAGHVGAHLIFRGQGAPQAGTAAINAAQISDRATTSRFNPVAASGMAALDGGVWKGQIALVTPKEDALGSVSFMHGMASGAGTAHIDAPHILFAPGKLQPADLSPLLAALRQASGEAEFSGDLQWSRDAVTSTGRLILPGLDFLTPLGPAHAVKTDFALISLLPPSAAPGQAVTISRIDWTLPLSAVALSVGFNQASVQLDKADTDIAQGHASLGALTIKLADPAHLSGTVQLAGIALDNLIAASNLGNRVKLNGKISGTVPFTVTPDGFRIVNGHVSADGPGRLSLDRSLWTQGEAALAANAVQDFAYQALENLAFEQLSADLNSTANGRLQVVFHIKGHSDPPQPQKAEVALTDIIKGTALTKPIPLPSGTPIDLTLDSSLNFDELLKSYAQAWSKTLGLAPDSVGGATP